MIINFDHKLAFVCTTKCASTSIEKFMRKGERIELTGSPQMKHKDAIFFKKKIKPFLTTAFPDSEFVSFALIREPIFWLMSWWKYRQRPNAPENVKTNNISFNDYVLDFMKPIDQRLPSSKLKYPRNWIIDDDGFVVVDKVFTVDKIEELEAFLTRQTGSEVYLEHLNKSTDTDLSTIRSLPETTTKIVNEVMNIEFQIYRAAMASPDHCRMQNCFHS